MQNFMTLSAVVHELSTVH